VSLTRLDRVELTSQQLSKVNEFRDQWLQIGLRGGPCDRPKVELALDNLYKLAKLDPPDKIWFDSPLASVIAAHLVSEDGTHLVSPKVLHHRRDVIRAAIFRQTAIHKTPHLLVAEAYISERVRRSNQIIENTIIAPEQPPREEENPVEWISDETYSSIIGQVVEKLGEGPNPSSLRRKFRERPEWSNVHMYSVFYGQFSAEWLFVYDFARKVCKTEVDGVDDILVLAEAGWLWAFDGVAILTDRPTVLKTDPATGRPHCADGPALKCADGFTLYAWKGMRTPEKVIKGDFTVKEIDAERNAEIRRVMIDKYGLSRYLLDSGAKKIHEDDFGVLYSKELPGDEPLMMVKVVNSTPEPDGSFKDYFLRVDPRAYGGLKTGRAAVASTWRYANGRFVFEKPEDYKPDHET